MSKIFHSLVHIDYLRVRSPLAVYQKVYAQNDIVIHQICSLRMKLNAGKVKLLPTDPIVLQRSNQDVTPF